MAGFFCSLFRTQGQYHLSLVTEVACVMVPGPAPAQLSGRCLHYLSFGLVTPPARRPSFGRVRAADFPAFLRGDAPVLAAALFFVVVDFAAALGVAGAFLRSFGVGFPVPRTTAGARFGDWIFAFAATAALFGRRGPSLWAASYSSS